MHFKTVLVFIYTLAHPLEFASVVELLCGFFVYSQVAKRSSVLVAFTESTFRQVEVMGRTEEKDTLCFGHIPRAIGPCSCRSGV